MSRMVNARVAPANSSLNTSGSVSPTLSASGGHGIPLGRANVSQVAQSISVAAVRALE